MHWRKRFGALGARRIALALDNGLDWLAVDLAARAEQLIVVPIAPFFSATQRLHALDSAGCDLLLTTADPDPGEPHRAAGFRMLDEAHRIRIWQRGLTNPPALPPGTFTISYTSGTTGTPKGVCLAADLLEQVAASLAERTAALGIGKHLCLLPLAVLLENVAGAWAALHSGARLILPRLAETGLAGSSGLDLACFAACLQRHQPHSIIVLPELLKALCHLVESKQFDPEDLRLVAVGGARTPATLIEYARGLGLPVFEGYGMTETGSVVCLNAPAADRIGSVGRPLAHQRLSRARDGELRVHGPRFLGYVGDAAQSPDEPFRTGDAGDIDGDGFVHVHGRVGNVYSTSWGRNVAPEWIEAELNAQAEITQSFVHGRDLPENLAVLVPSAAGEHALQAAVERVNRDLPDYARISRWRVRARPFSTDDGTATANGRLRRGQILALHAEHLGLPDPGDRSCPTASSNEPPSMQTANPSMTFYQTLQHQTETARAGLLSQPVIQRALAGRIDRATYLAFLHEAYHHVRHTVPLLMACGARLPARLEWLRTAMAEYIEEEIGHQEWILNDIGAAGGDPDRSRNGHPSLATETMVAYAYHTIDRGNPVGFLGMVHVLEGTSVALADSAADMIGKTLGLPRKAFSYLISHGSLDQQHVKFFEDLVNRVDATEDQREILRCANNFYRLYGEIFGTLEHVSARAA
ncbi:MAG: AMP-binding protein [Wenzhouxiangellaceae bacterium]|nr:AMP-binding protein [Wenzhouxiangellaceae bacterium]